MIARRQYLIFGAIFATVIALLALIYFLVLRTEYAPLFENLRESDASAIVAELDKQGMDYQLANDGHDILVPEQEVGSARLALAGSNVAVGGVVGFELFNESDMGLTEFAQKINYQRALQGELSRTIMMMDGIEFARVHLALPEKSIFRAAQSQPTAAVTIQTIDRKDLSPERVAGIQQLVASSVPDLPINSVAILDDRGDLLSQPVANGDGETAAVDERAALEQYFRARAQTAISQILPGLHSEVKIFASKPVESEPAGDAGLENAEAVPAAPAAPKASGDREFQLRVVVRTAAALSAEDNGLLRTAVLDALKLNLDAGDSLTFEVGKLGFSPGQALPVPGDNLPQSSVRETPRTANSWSNEADWMRFIFNRWFFAAFLMIAVIGLLLWRQRRQMSEEERDSFAELLADGLAAQQGKRNAG